MGGPMLCGKPVNRRRGVRCEDVNSIRRGPRVAYEVARAALPGHWRKCGPTKLSRPQLLARLVLKEFLKGDHCGLAAHLATIRRSVVDRPECGPPRHTAFPKAAARRP